MADLHIANVDPEVLREFKRFVLNKHGKLRGALSEEVTNALRFYLEYNKDHPHAKLQKHLEKPRKKHLRLLQWLYNFDGELITDRVINKFIRDLGVVSKPTIRDYWNFALAFLWEEQVDNRTKPVTVYYSIDKDAVKKFLEKHGVKIDEEEIKPKGIVIDPNNGNGSKDEIKELAVDRYRMGDSLEEIQERLELLTGGFIPKKAVKALVKKGLKEEGGL